MADRGGDPDGEEGYPRAKKIGLVAGPVLFALVLLAPTPEGLGRPGQAVLATALWMAAWWITEAIPLGVTSLLPLVALPVLDVLGPAEVARSYADPAVFLFMGGFILAQAFQRWGLHERVAYGILSRVGASPRRLVLAFMVVTAGLSMWVSNTATAVMMLPIGVAVAGKAGSAGRAGGSSWRYGLRTVLMLGIAYAASIGGLATLVGTPPNLIFAGQVGRLVPGAPEISFLRWMLLGVPLAAVYLAAAWAYLAYVVLSPDAAQGAVEGSEKLEAQEAALGPMGRPQWAVAIVFVVTVLAWIFRADLALGAVTIPGWATQLGLDVHDGTVAMVAAIVLFLIPVDLEEGEFVMDWETAVGIPWEVLILFGGGFALAAGFTSTGVAAWLATRLTGLAGLPLPLLILTVCVVVIVGSEIASNTALTALMLPVLAASADGLGLDPLWVMVPATLAASTGFMLPVATPPNAVAFASGYVTAPEMARVGFVLDLMGAVFVTIASLTLMPLVFGL